MTPTLEQKKLLSGLNTVSRPLRDWAADKLYTDDCTVQEVIDVLHRATEVVGRDKKMEIKATIKVYRLYLANARRQQLTHFWTYEAKSFKEARQQFQKDHPTFDYLNLEVLAA